MASIERSSILYFSISLLLAWSGNVVAEDGAYRECHIEYHIKHVAQPGKHTDTGPFTKKLTGCVRDLNDCIRRSTALVRARESRFVPEGEGQVPDLSSIRVSTHRIEGHCNTLDE